jgi:hypothetical protein
VDCASFLGGFLAWRTGRTCLLDVYLVDVSLVEVDLHVILGVCGFGRVSLVGLVGTCTWRVPYFLGSKLCILTWWT